MKILLLLSFILVLGSSVIAEEIQVGQDFPIRSIAAALETASDGDEILVHSGTYREHDLKIVRSVTLKGVGQPVIDGELKGNTITIEADGVTLDGFTIKNVERSFTKDYAAIVVTRSRDFTITNNVIQNAFFGIMLQKSKSGLIAFNDITGDAVQEAGSGNGVHVWHCSEIVVHDNKLHELRDGIYLEFVKKSEIYNNLSYDNLRYGLHFMFSDHDDYHHNLFRNNGAGVAVMFSKFIKMEHNTFTKNWGAASYGLLLKEIYDAEITDNIFEQNTVGIHGEGSTRINYERNLFKRNGWAIKITGACYTNKFESNDFVHNTFDLSYNSQLNDNTFDGNYWSDYTGYDLDRDGVGDHPYRPIKLFSYVVSRTPESIVLLRSLFIDIINFSEKVSPVFTPDGLLDNRPVMKARLGVSQ
jgi:nitrous oxidase accessory protein